MPSLSRSEIAPPFGFSSLCLTLCWLASAACTLTGNDFNPSLADEETSDTPGSEPSVPANEPPDSSDNPGGLGGAAGQVSETTGGGTSVGLPGGAEPNPSNSIPLAPVDAGASEPDPVEPDPVEPDRDTLVGWASVSGLGVTTTSGGGALGPVVADSADALIDLAGRPEPLVIGIAGTLDVPLVALTSNKTLVGMDAGATLRGGVRVRGTANAFVSNVIVRNLHIDAATSDAEGDGIQIHYAHHVWVDHCSISDAADGLIDIVHGSDFITLSFNRLFYTSSAPDLDHRFANLIGHSNTNTTEDDGHLNVTLHHNEWGEGVIQAVSARFGLIHVFDNVFASPGNSSVLSAGLDSRLLIENNRFDGVAAPHAIAPDSAANVLATGNVYVGTSGAQATTGAAFTPQYPYQLDSAAELSELLQTLVGPR